MREDLVFGRNSVLEALRSGTPIDRIYLLEGSGDGPLLSINREAAKRGIPVRFVSRKRLDEMTENASHQGACAQGAAHAYGSVEDILNLAKERGEDPFLILLDGIEDPHNLGAVLRTANLAGAHGLIIPKDNACPLTGAAAKTSAGAVNYTPVAKVTNLVRTMKELKKKGIWFVGGDLQGKEMYSLDLKGPIGLVIGSEKKGLSRLVREECDLLAAIPMKGQIDSLNASVAAGILCYEIYRQRWG
ncbi:MAG: 23S rRNA (guanosine(2251)-2'-O)-methyltransferase RlmB [Lachnospiraceae bacterium]|nr:23S rRNA (guanosine(2251)-2'-O)-methyltransferase RlmB [Lachnospiraceae bacterium]